MSPNAVDEPFATKIDGEPLFVPLVEHGRIVFGDSFEEQAERADRTWGSYKRFTLSDKVHDWRERFRAMRDDEMTAARQRLAAGGFAQELRCRNPPNRI